MYSYKHLTASKAGIFISILSALLTSYTASLAQVTPSPHHIDITDNQLAELTYGIQKNGKVNVIVALKDTNWTALSSTGVVRGLIEPTKMQ